MNDDDYEWWWWLPMIKDWRHDYLRLAWRVWRHFHVDDEVHLKRNWWGMKKTRGCKYKETNKKNYLSFLSKPLIPTAFGDMYSLQFFHGHCLPQACTLRCDPLLLDPFAQSQPLRMVVFSVKHFLITLDLISWDDPNVPCSIPILH